MGKRKQRKFQESSTFIRSICPAVSVIIPMYNAEKYVSECLDSLLAQTFTDFEVIVVDDRSTDSSAAIVESYASKFNGRLMLTKTLKNSGGGGFPRNKGLTLSRGEYISFIDADDTITPTALEELYTLAKDFDADVIACEKFYSVPENLWYDAKFRAQLKPTGYNFVSKPTMISFDVAERINDCYNHGFLWNPWSKLVRRNLILENEFVFASGIVTEDVVFTICLLCTAKNFVRVPNIVNYYRVVDNSVSHEKKDPVKHFQKYVREWFIGFKHLNKFLSERDFFKQNHNVKYLALEIHLHEIMNYIIGLYAQIPAPAIDEILSNEFGNAETTFLFNRMNIQHLQSLQMNSRFNQFADAANKRIAELEAEVKRLQS